MATETRQQLPRAFPAKVEREGKARKNYIVAYEYPCDCGNPKVHHTATIAMLSTIGKGLSQRSLAEKQADPYVVEAAMYVRDGDEWIRMDDDDAYWPEGVREPTYDNRVW